MDADNKTDAEILDELENIYQRIAKEDVGKIDSADLNELFETDQGEQQGKKLSPLALHGMLLLAVCLFLGIVLTVIIRPTEAPVSSTPAKKPAVVKTPTYRIPITIPPASPETDVKTPSETETGKAVVAAIPDTDVKTPPEAETEKVVAAVQDKSKETPPAPAKKEEKVVAAVQDKSEETPPAPAKKEETESRKEIEPVIEKPYTIQISSIRNHKIAKDFLRKISVSQPDIHWDRLNSKKYGVWYRVFIGHFASRTEALRYMKEKNIRKTYPGSYILSIPASPPRR